MKTDRSVRLNIGCGKKVLEGYIGVDRFANDGVTDVIHDLERFPWPFEEGTVDEVLLDNVLEHLDDVVRTMEELYRILKPGGTARIIVPHVTSTFAFADPTHKHYFAEESFSYFTSAFSYNYYSPARFSVARITHIIGGRGVAKLRRYIPFRRFLMKFFWNLCDAMDIILVKE